MCICVYVCMCMCVCVCVCVCYVCVCVCTCMRMQSGIDLSTSISLNIASACECKKSGLYPTALSYARTALTLLTLTADPALDDTPAAHATWLDTYPLTHALFLALSDIHFLKGQPQSAMNALHCIVQNATSKMDKAVALNKVNTRTISHQTSCAYTCVHA